MVEWPRAPGQEPGGRHPRRRSALADRLRLVRPVWYGQRQSLPGGHIRLSQAGRLQHGVGEDGHQGASEPSGPHEEAEGEADRGRLHHHGP